MNEFKEYKFNFFSTENIILFIFLLVTIFLLYKNYQTPVDKKSYIINVYLYILASVLFISIASQYIASLHFVNTKNYYIFLLLYLVLAFGSFFIMLQQNFYYNHLGYLLFLIAMSLIVGITIKNSEKIKKAAFITSGIVILLTLIVFIAPENTLEIMRSWMPGLMSLLCALIIIEIIAIIFFPSIQTFKYLSTIAIILFVFITLSDTSRIISEKNLLCNTHECINYPQRTTTLILDYVNIFLNVLFLRS